MYIMGLHVHERRWIQVEEDIKAELPIVVWKDNMSKAEGALAVPSKGDYEYAIRGGAQDVNKILGYNKMIFKEIRNQR